MERKSSGLKEHFGNHSLTGKSRKECEFDFHCIIWFVETNIICRFDVSSTITITIHRPSLLMKQFPLKKYSVGEYSGLGIDLLDKCEVIVRWTNSELTYFRHRPRIGWHVWPQGHRAHFHPAEFRNWITYWIHENCGRRFQSPGDGTGWQSCIGYHWYHHCRKNWHRPAIYSAAPSFPKLLEIEGTVNVIE